AAERAGAAGMPSAEEEVWRYSRIGELDLGSFTPGHAVTTVEGGDGASVVVGGQLGDRFASIEAVDLFHELNSAFMDAVVVSVPGGRALAEPIFITHHIDTAGVACFPRLIIDAAPDSEVTVVEQFVSSDGVRSLCVPRLEVDAGQSARVRYLGINLLGSSTW